MTNYEYFYPGSADNLDKGSDSLYTGYSIKGPFGGTTSVQTANKIKEVTNLLNQGMNVIEVSDVQPEVFEMIPKQHMKEIDRLSQLTGAQVSVHAPIIEPSGFTQQGWSEQDREASERHITDTVLRAHAMNPKGEMPVTFHASAIPGTEYVPIDAVKDLTKEEKEQWGEKGMIPSTMIAVDQETGQFIPLRREKRFYPGKPGKMYAPEEELEIANRGYWDNKLSNLIFYKKEADILLESNMPLLSPEIMKGLASGKIQLKNMPPQIRSAWNAVNNAGIYVENTWQTLNSLYNQAYKYADKKGKEALSGASQDFGKRIKEIGAESRYNPRPVSDAMQDLLLTMKDITTEGKTVPHIYKPVEDFVMDKASDTFSNVAWKAYDKYGKNAPIVSIENPPYGSAVANAADLRRLIERTRDKFVDKARKEGMSSNEAEKAAEQMIGATWDTSHISLMRKQGFKSEALVDEAKIIAPYLKHVHLNDNFGHTHTDLPPGMGNVPIADIMKEFEKKGFKGKKIFEGGNFFQHFQTSPHPMVLEAMGSPVYGMVAQPTWNQIVYAQGHYSTGYGNIFPEQHSSIYGTGWSGLPVELGGQAQGRQSRFSGTPNA